MIDLNSYNLKKLNHVIYYEWYLDIRAGGPTGYLANLLDGLNRIENNINPMIFFDTIPKQLPAVEPVLNHSIKSIHDFFYKNEKRKTFYINYISRYQEQKYIDYCNFLNNIENMYCNSELFKKINMNNTKTIHVHTIGDAVKLKNSLNKIGNRSTKIMLTCHTPEAPSDEYFKAYLEEGHNLKRATTVKHLWKNIEKKAFESADILVFPSVESMEPLSLTMDGFTEIQKNKDIRFLPSGAKALKSSLTKKEAKKKYGVEGKFVIGYVGRHNEIKGYDILKSAAEKILQVDKNICFLIGGSQGKTFKPLNDKNWIEAGWVNPADLFMALDAFVLPNRMTYFDLVLLEVMSMGVPIIASNTGGNKSVQETTNALTLYNDVSELVQTILNIKSKNPVELQQMSQKVYSAYMTNYIPEIFAKNYLNLINQIYSDYNFFRVGEYL